VAYITSSSVSAGGHAAASESVYIDRGCVERAHGRGEGERTVRKNVGCAQLASWTPVPTAAGYHGVGETEDLRGGDDGGSVVRWGPPRVSVLGV